MALFVKVTEECRIDAEAHSLSQQIDNAVEQLEMAQRVVGFHDFPPPFIRKRLGNFRLVAARHDVGEDTVITLLRIYPRSSDDYREFLDDRNAFRDRELIALVDESAMPAFIAASRINSSVVELSEPSPEESGFLFEGLSFQYTNTGEVIVCETQDWVDAMKSEKMISRLSDLNRELVALIGAGDDRLGMQRHAWRGGEIAFRYFRDSQRLLLVGVGDKSQIDTLLMSGKYSLASSSKTLDVEEIGKVTRRTYPQLVLADEDAWFAIQRNDEANLSLSFEETQVLYSAAPSQSEQQGEVTGFPLFVNGRAGSGKSTILQYLFSDYLARYLQMPSRLPEPPAYFTYNTELLQRARAVVESLLQHGAHRLVHGAAIDIQTEAESIGRAFHNLHTFLYDMLPSESKRTRFRADRFVSYGKFKQMWERRFGKAATHKDRREYGPDLSWHVIRSYIKGMSLEPGEPLDPDDYALLPQKRRTVTQDTYDTIFEKVYVSWYATLGAENAAWDDQDLAHALLQQGVKSRFPAIFCDEAQDFTPLEIEVLHRLSLFSARKLRSHMIKRVPLVFAGDPFQTLNPTGFSWEAIKANYSTKLLDNSDPDSSMGPQINYRELEYNYRSTPPIVRFCNTLQAVRSLLLDIRLAPQLVWGPESVGQNPMWFDLADQRVQEQLKHQSELTIIVPVDEGEESSYVENDALLREIVVRDERGIPRNVQSPMRVKGLEFNRVVLYGFGNAAPDALVAMLGSPTEMTREELLPFEYFVNRLYVAASRPKRRLFVVDSRHAIDGFWSYFRLEDRLRLITSRLRSASTWNDQLGRLQEGRPDAWEAEREDPATVAARIKTEGLSKSDSYLLRQAALQFDAVGLSTESALCRAEALALEGEPAGAAREFLRVNEKDRAVSALWKANDLTSLAKLHSDHNLGRSFEVRITELLQDDVPPPAQGLAIIRELYDSAKGNADLQTRLFTELTWGERIVEIGIAIAESDDAVRGSNLAVVVSQLMEKFHEINTVLPLVPFAYLQYLAQKGADALSTWDEVGSKHGKYDYTEQHETLRALAMPFPESLSALIEMGQGQSALNLYQEEIDKADLISQSDVAGLVTACLTLGDTGTAQELVKRIDSPPNLLGVLVAVLEKDATDDLGWLVLQRLVTATVITADVFIIESLIVKSNFPDELLNRPSLRKHSGAIKNYLRQTKELWHTHLLRLLARSDKLANLPRGNVRDSFSKLKGSLFDLDNPIYKKLDHFEIGAIVERLGSDVDALGLYEKYQANGLGAAVQDFAVERWIAVKERQAQDHQDRNQVNNASKYANEARDARRAHGIPSERRMPRYPTLSAISTEERGQEDQGFATTTAFDLATVEASAGKRVSNFGPLPIETTHSISETNWTEKLRSARNPGTDTEPPTTGEKTPTNPKNESVKSVIELSVGQLRIRYFAETGRINLEDTNSGETLAIAPGRDPASMLEVHTSGNGVYSIVDWNLEVRVHDEDCLLYWNDSRIELRFPRPTSQD